MILPRTAADVLKNRVTLEVEGVDRMDLDVFSSRPPLTSLFRAVKRTLHVS